MLALLPLLLVLAAEPKEPAPKKAEGKLESQTPRRPHPLAPSLPELSDAEEKKLDAAIDRFIDADIGKSKGAEAKQAMEDFKNLGPESFFALVRGLNKSASIDHSCPAVTIARKLTGIIRASDDRELVQFARENVGAGVKRSPHMVVLDQVKSAARSRLNSLGR